MLSLQRGRITSVVERNDGVTRLEVDGIGCIAFPRVTGPIAVGDDVLVNVQARRLRLGSGGFDVLYANLTRGLQLAANDAAHVMKLPYTPLQFAARYGEEDLPQKDFLDGLPVVSCSLHSQVAPVCAGLRGHRVAYVQLEGGALPLPLSDTLRALRARELVDMTLSVGACFGGEVECVSVHSALCIAAAAGAHAIVCAIGPGIVGTATRFGHGAMAAASSLAATSELGGTPILVSRMSQTDERPRHRGVSHHTADIVALWGGTIQKPWPSGCPIDHPLAEGADHVDVAGWREACADLPLLHMGRGPDDDPWFFAAAYAAGRYAQQVVDDAR